MQQNRVTGHVHKHQAMKSIAVQPSPAGPLTPQSVPRRTLPMHGPSQPIRHGNGKTLNGSHCPNTCSSPETSKRWGEERQGSAITRNAKKTANHRPGSLQSNLVSVGELDSGKEEMSELCLFCTHLPTFLNHPIL